MPVIDSDGRLKLKDCRAIKEQAGVEFRMVGNSRGGVPLPLPVHQIYSVRTASLRLFLPSLLCRVLFSRLK